MAELNSFKECREYLDKGKYRLKTMDRPIAHNTRVIQLDDGTIGIKLHDTYIIKYYSNLLDGKYYDLKDDSIQLNTGGWKTVTTRDRMNRFCPLHVWTESNIMYVSKHNWYTIYQNKKNGIESKVFHFRDRMWFNPDGKVWVKENSEPIRLKPFSKKEEQKKRKQLKAINTFICNYVNKLTSGKMGKPGGGDCFYCQGESNPNCTTEFGTLSKDEGYKKLDKPNPDHLISHIKEKYYVPSIVWSAIRSECYDSEGVWGNPNMTSGLAEVDKHNISCYFNPNAGHKPMANDMTERRLKKIMKQYFIKRLSDIL
jgi:hypothetical protein